MAVAKKTKPALWARAKAQAKAKMGGKHSARAMQLATKIYKKAGGGYRGSKSSSNKLTKWGKEKWQTSSGKNQQLTQLKHVVIKKENSSLNNQKVLQPKQKDLDEEIYK